MNPVFIVGTQRSGTTLLRLILNAHSEIAIPEEANFLMPLLKRKYLRGGLRGDLLSRIASYLQVNPQFKLWNYDSSDFILSLRSRENISLRDLVDGLFLSYCRAMNKAGWGDKTPSFFRKLDVILDLFPDARIIHIIRDGRDVFDSWRKMDPTKNYVGVVALEWRYKIWKIEKSLAEIPDGRKMTVRYEDLLEKPRETVSGICDFCGVPFEQGMMNFYETSDRYVGEHHSNLIFGPLDAANRFKWRQNLTLGERRIFQSVAGMVLRKYRYETEDVAMRFSDALFVLRNLTAGLPLRAFQVARTKLMIERAVQKGGSAGLGDVGKMPKRRN